MTQNDKVMSIVLDAVDDCSEGLNLDEACKVFRPRIGFPAFVFIINRLVAMGLIDVDSNHIAHRVKSHDHK